MSERCCTLSGLLEERAQQHPERTVYRWLRDGETESAALTYAELDRQARRIATRLEPVVSPGDRVLLVFPPGLEFIPAFFGCLYAGVLAVPATYPKPRRPMPRLAMMASDCQPAAVLTTAQTLAALEVARTAPELASLPWIAADEIADGAEAAWRRPDLSRDSLAFLQYTSGSTSDPKGVMVSHGNLLHNLETIRHGFGIARSTKDCALHTVLLQCQKPGGVATNSKSCNFSFVGVESVMASKFTGSMIGKGSCAGNGNGFFPFRSAALFIQVAQQERVKF